MKKILTTIMVIVTMTFTIHGQTKADSATIDETFILNLEKSIGEMERKIIDINNELEKNTIQSSYREEATKLLEQTKDDLQRNKYLLSVCLENQKLKNTIRELNDEKNPKKNEKSKKSYEQ